MFTQRLMTGFILAGLAGAVLVGQATAQPSSLAACQQQCDGDTICRQACASEKQRKRIVHRLPPRPDTPPPPAVKTWQDDVFNQGNGGGGGGGGGR